MGAVIGILDALAKRLQVPDNLPSSRRIRKNCVVFCHTYSMAENKMLLTQMSQQSLIVAGNLLRNGYGNYLVSSVAKFGEVSERKCRRQLLRNMLIGESQYQFLEGARDTFHEIEQLVGILKSRGARALIIVGDRNHIRRSLTIDRRLLPGFVVYNAASVTEIYEKPCLVSDDATSKERLIYALQRWSISSKAAHIIWNYAMLKATPFLMRKMKPW